MPVYQWRTAERGFFEKKADAQEVGERLEALKQRKADKRITASDVVQDAVKKVSPLHPLFEWSDNEAANLYREQQARHVLGALVTVSVERNREPQESRVFVSVTRAMAKDSEPKGYVTVTDLADSDYQEIVERRARQELRSWTTRYAGVEALQELVEQIRDLVDAELMVGV